MSNSDIDIKIQEDLKAHDQSALVEGAAQTIYDELRKVEIKHSDYTRRFLWELLQNAVDATESKPVRVSIEVKDWEFIFRHNGSPFTTSELAHLRLYGTTKRESKRVIGKFGKGFIATHLISKKVVVQGFLRDYPRFFTLFLDRDVGNVKELESKIRDLVITPVSVQLLPNVEEGFTTKYVYPLSTNQADLLSQSIRDFKELIPWVLAFENRIESVALCNRGVEVTWTRGKIIDYGEKKIVIIERSFLGKHESLYFAIVASEREPRPTVQIAVCLAKSGANFQVMSIESVPKLFISFPLIGTQDFPSPFVVDSLNFEPLDERNGLHLREEISPETTMNKNLLEGAYDLFRKLLSWGVDEGWVDLHFLVMLPSFQIGGGIDKNWLKNLVCRKLIRYACNKRILKTAEGIKSAPSYVSIPVSGEEETLQKIWFCAEPLCAGEIPSQDTLVLWSRIRKAWDEYVTREEGFLLRNLTINGIAGKVERAGSILELQAKHSKLSDESKLYSWLCGFLGLVSKHESGLFDSKVLLPDQRGEFKTRTKVKLDCGINEKLIDCAEALGWNLRSQLLDRKVSAIVGNLLDPCTQDEVVRELLEKAKELAKTKEPSDSCLTSIRTLFEWLVKNRLTDRIGGDFPFVNRRGDVKKRERVISYSKPEEKLLVPQDLWPEEAKKNVLSDEFILSSSYTDLIDLDDWKQLVSHNVLEGEPLFVEKRKLGKRNLDLMASEELQGENHRTVDEVEISRVTFLEKEDKGIYYLVRGSMGRAREFLRFLFDYIIKVDEKWRKKINVKCECGDEHEICPAQWLGYIRASAWVPGKEEEPRETGGAGHGRRHRRYFRPSGESLAGLFEGDPDLQERLNDMAVLRFLDKIGIGAQDILQHLYAKDDEGRLATQQSLANIMIKTGGKHLQELSKIAGQMSEEGFRNAVFKLIERGARIKENQEVGDFVEKYLEELLESAEGTYELSRTGVGSDYEAIYDFVRDGEEQMLEIRRGKANVPIEIKSARGVEVEMTPTQARKAVEREKSFVLCVVEIPGEEITREIVKENSRFVFNIGSKLKEKVEKERTHSDSLKQLSSEAGEIGLTIRNLTLRYRIPKSIWQNGMKFEEFKRFLESIPDSAEASTA